MRTGPIPLLLRSLLLINTLWLPAGVLYFVEHVSLTASLGAPALLSRWLDPAIGFAAKVVFLCWLWTFLPRTLSGERHTADYHHFLAGLRRGWTIAAATVALPWAVHLGLFLLTTAEPVPLTVLQGFLVVPTTLWAAGHFLRMTYGAPSGRTPTRRLVGWAGLLLPVAAGLSLAAAAISLRPAVIALELLQVQTLFLVSVLFFRVLLDDYPGLVERFSSAKTLILVNPPAGSLRVEAFSTVTIRSYPPFFAVLRALTPADYRIVEYNRVLWRDHFYRGNALVAISCVTANCAAAYQIAREFRERGARVVIGGPHVSFFPEEALEFADSVAAGAAEGVWPEVVRDYEAGTLKQIYRGECSTEGSAQVERWMRDAPPEVIASSLQTGSGCKFNCYFCSTAALMGGVRSKKTVPQVVELVKRAGRQPWPLVFLDNNIYEDPAYARELFRALVPLKRAWAASSSIDIARDDEALQLLKESRCVQLLVGYEIDEGSTLRAQGGKFALAKDYIALTRKLQRAGIAVQAHFIFGFPGDSWRSLFRLWWFCLRLGATYTWTAFLTPLPGARYFRDAFQQGRILNLNWRCYDVMRQVTGSPQLKRSALLTNTFTPISFFVFLTTSWAGRFLVLVFVLLEYLYYRRG